MLRFVAFLTGLFLALGPLAEAAQLGPMPGDRWEPRFQIQKLIGRGPPGASIYSTGPKLTPKWLAGPIYPAGVFNIVSDGATGNTQSILAAINAISALQGGVLLLPCGTTVLDATLTYTVPNVVIRGGGQCTHLVSNFLTGDVIDMGQNLVGGTLLGGNGIEDMYIGDISARYRTSGFTVNMTGDGMQSVRRVYFTQCYICIQMASPIGDQYVEDVKMDTITPDSTSTGSGGIVINGAIGPANYIINVDIYGQIGAGPARFGIHLLNSGGVFIDNTNILQAFTDVWVNPGTGQTVQATYITNSYIADSPYLTGIDIEPTGNGYVNTFYVSHGWFTNFQSGSIPAVQLVGAASTPPAGFAFPIMDVKIDNSFFLNESSSTTSTGLYVGDAKANNITLTNSTITGYGTGVFLGANVVDVTMIGNHIGAYSPANSGRSGNVTGVQIQTGASDRIVMMGNTIHGNTTANTSIGTLSGANNILTPNAN